MQYVTPALTAIGVRTIAVNFAGFGTTSDERSLRHVNVERIAFVEALVAALRLTPRLVFVGHSRGTENALMLAARNQDLADGAVMINPTGLRIHRGCRPLFFFTALSWLYFNVPLLRSFLEWGEKLMYDRVGLRVASGRVAAVAVHCMASLALGDQAPFMRQLQASGRARLLFCYSGNDWIIEREVSQEFEAMIKNNVHLECTTDEMAEEVEITRRMQEAFERSSETGDRAVSAFFHTDNHYIQKHRADFVARAALESSKEK